MEEGLKNCIVMATVLVWSSDIGLNVNISTFDMDTDVSN